MTSFAAVSRTGIHRSQSRNSALDRKTVVLLGG
jgi:hypothetical protein